MKLRQFIIISLFIISTNSMAQSFNIGHTTITYRDSSRSRNISTEIYYPGISTGQNVAVDSGSFPILIFGHGFLMSWNAYQNFWTELVPKGYVMCFPTTEMSISPNHGAFGLDLEFLAAQMQNENLDSTSLFFNSLALETALMGHSMGGGASFLAAENNTTISALVNFAAAETTPSAIAAALNVNVPSLVFSGDDDCVAPTNTNQTLMYDSLSPICKTHIRIINGGHCYFANNNFNCNLGESFCNPTLNISRAQQQSVTFDFLNPWLAYSLKGDTSAWTRFNDSLQNSSRINSSQRCNITSVQELHVDSEIKLYPNPASNQINLAITEEQRGGRLQIYNVLGKKLHEHLIKKDNVQIDVSHLPTGTYLVLISKEGYLYSTKFIK
ncbi:MAG: dienelactone hydrolase [Vicingaceae bacterium]|jgi:dienelactone hydrolase